jgi:uncharacterized protein
MNDEKGTGEACPLPSSNRRDDADADPMRRMLRARRIAVVGLSHKTHRASWQIAQYIRSVGKEVIPVNPRYQEVMGVSCYPKVSAIPGKVDAVDVFRRAEFCPDVVRDAIAAGAGGVWLQSGIVSDEARHLAEGAGLDYVEDRCYMVEHMHRA